jgi:hypothetical protein
MAGWDQLLELATAELGAAAAGRWDALDALGADRAALAASLGEPTPADRPLLERVMAVNEQLVATILRGRSATLDELAHLRRGCGAVAGYAAATAGPRHGWVDHSG